MKGFVLVMFALLTQQALAQFEKGDKVLGGSLSFTRVKGRSGPIEETRTDFEFAPGIGFLINANVEFGAEISLLRSINDRTEYKQSGNGFGPALFASRYISINKVLLFRIKGEIFYEWNRGSYTPKLQQGPSAEFETERYGLAISPGLIFFPDTNWGMSLTFGNLYLVKGLAEGSRSTEFGINTGNIALGLSYYFRRSESSD